MLEWWATDFTTLESLCQLDLYLDSGICWVIYQMLSLIWQRCCLQFWFFFRDLQKKKNIRSYCHLSLSFQFADDCPIWIQGSLTELIPTGNHQKTLLGVHHMYCFIKEIKKTNLIFVFWINGIQCLKMKQENFDFTPIQ